MAAVLMQLHENSKTVGNKIWRKGRKGKGGGGGHRGFNRGTTHVSLENVNSSAKMGEGNDSGKENGEGKGFN